jgi:phosphoesterase RecJ-like protein
MMSIDWQPLLEVISSSESFLITSHCRADCDALGSELGLAQVLESLGKRVRIVNGDKVPRHIGFIDPHQRIEMLDRDVSGSEALLELDVLVVVDTSAWSQLGPMADVVRQFAGKKIVIDHHVSQDDMQALVFKDATAEATGRLILELATELGAKVTPDIAMPLFAAIATDTGWFRFSSVTEKTFTALARLVAAGANPPDIFSALYEQHRIGRLLLRGRILQRVRADVDGRLLWTEVTLKDFHECGAERTDTEDVINLLLTIAGSEVAVMFVELDERFTKISLRSRGDFDVCQVARQFGGGGHRAASGITFEGSLVTARSAVLDALSQTMGRLGVESPE